MGKKSENKISGTVEDFRVLEKKALLHKRKIPEKLDQVNILEHPEDLDILKIKLKGKLEQIGGIGFINQLNSRGVVLKIPDGEASQKDVDRHTEKLSKTVQVLEALVPPDKWTVVYGVAATNRDPGQMYTNLVAYLKEFVDEERLMGYWERYSKTHYNQGELLDPLHHMKMQWHYQKARIAYGDPITPKKAVDELFQGMPESKDIGRHPLDPGAWDRIHDKVEVAIKDGTITSTDALVQWVERKTTREANLIASRRAVNAPDGRTPRTPTVNTAVTIGDGRCFHCCRVGHRAFECAAKKKGEPRSCNVCYQQGHTGKDCPTKLMGSPSQGLDVKTLSAAVQSTLAQMQADASDDASKKKKKKKKKKGTMAIVALSKVTEEDRRDGEYYGALVQRMLNPVTSDEVESVLHESQMQELLMGEEDPGYDCMPELIHEDDQWDDDSDEDESSEKSTVYANTAKVNAVRAHTQSKWYMTDAGNLCKEEEMTKDSSANVNIVDTKKLLCKGHRL